MMNSSAQRASLSALVSECLVPGGTCSKTTGPRATSGSAAATGRGGTPRRAGRLNAPMSATLGLLMVMRFVPGNSQTDGTPDFSSIPGKGAKSSVSRSITLNLVINGKELSIIQARFQRHSIPIPEALPYHAGQM